MGLQEIQKVELEYDPHDIDEKKEIFDRLDDLKRKGILEDWKITGSEDRDTQASQD